ncbi:endo-1,3-beta glucanase [Ophidiomyces ophidiicola]|uniref:endo-1,3-beta glucanase n=1 Tax=Ophidiomyces ophidiicola TaxID=1387563 RepID=UPI0020C54990|nr:endo-1,3-beta glucanase [Ophidiomyces ophidiicola]KAI1943188.1 endo-1,3-beta glucanase [Ophidiomyces ophidiicola]KAI2060621.1 endo-1,3-beta glucanase [Ophidiomyces ophidiicola]
MALPLARWLTQAMLISSGLFAGVQSLPYSPNPDPADAQHSPSPRSPYPSFPVQSLEATPSAPLRYPPKPTRLGTKQVPSERGYFNTSSEISTYTPPGFNPEALPYVPYRPAPPFRPLGMGQNVFLPVSDGRVPLSIPKRGDHPIKPNHIINPTAPISTNKFFANFFLGNQQEYTFTLPYSVGWSKGTGPANSYGMAISHVDANQRVLGERVPSIPGNPARFFYSPARLQSIILSATELGNSTTLSVAEPQAGSANVLLKPQPSGSNGTVSFPLVQGMGFVTAIYDNLQPLVQTGIFFRTVSAVTCARRGIYKYITILENGARWVIYVTPANGVDPKFKLLSNHTIEGPRAFKGTIQVAKDPGNADALYDRTSGVYPTSVSVSGLVTGATGTYQFSWAKAGNSKDTPLLMFALPHHVEAFDDSSKKSQTDLRLQTPTKGIATACLGDSWTMVEQNLPINMGFEPWQSSTSVRCCLPPASQKIIREAAASEMSQNMRSQTDLDSMYFSGKALAKFAIIVYTVHEMLQDPKFAASALQNLKDSFASFVQNKQKHPLVYDAVWKGVVSSAAYTTGDLNADFGNSLYNDHHFHYGYFVLAAAIIGKLDPSWLPANKAWVNTLVRDYANPVSDEQFPFSRGFDWYNGHSWAKGIFPSGDGKDQESTSEDSMCTYAIKMWGATTGDASMEARGNLMLGILKRSLNDYFLMHSSNIHQPKEFIANKVTGILFENKCDHTTYFGAKLEYIQGIHMLPILPVSAYIRDKGFVREEWDAMFAPNATLPAQTAEGGWRGILYSNLALIDPTASWDFFAQQNFSGAWLDGGASRTWSLAYAAGLGGGPRSNLTTAPWKYTPR